MGRHQTGFHRIFQCEYGPDCPVSSLDLCEEDGSRHTPIFIIIYFFIKTTHFFFRSMNVKAARVLSTHQWDSLPRKFLLSCCLVLRRSHVFLCKDKVCLTFPHKIFFYPRCNVSINRKPPVFVFPSIQSLLMLSLHRLFSPITVTIGLPALLDFVNRCALRCQINQVN